MTDPDDDGLLVTRLVIERRIVGDDDRVITDFSDRNGDDPPLIDIQALPFTSAEASEAETLTELPSVAETPSLVPTTKLETVELAGYRLPAGTVVAPTHLDTPFGTVGTGPDGLAAWRVR